MTFPAPWLIKHEVFTGTGEDDLGNDAETWAAPVNAHAIAISPSSVESITGYTSRVVSDVDMAVPVTVSATVRDRFLLPPDYDPPFEVVAIEDARYGFHQWPAGIILKLKRVTG